MLGRKIARHGLTLIATALLGGFLSATLVRVAPGLDADESTLDPHLSSQSIHALREHRAAQHNVFRFYLRSLQRVLHGDLGTSISLKQPVGRLLHVRPLMICWPPFWPAYCYVSLRRFWLCFQFFGMFLALSPSL